MDEAILRRRHRSSSISPLQNPPKTYWTHSTTLVTDGRRVLLAKEDTSMAWFHGGKHEIEDATPECTAMRALTETTRFKVSETNLRLLGTASGLTTNRFTPAKRTARPPPRGQHRRGRDAHHAHHPVSRYDDRATPLVVSTRHQRHPHPTPLHPFSREYLGGYPQPRTRYGRLPTEPPPIRPPPSTVGTHTMDIFASMINTQLPRFNARWRDPQCEDVDFLRMPDAAWQRENNSCNPPRTALQSIAAQLR
jgi:hypothetical protein